MVYLYPCSTAVITTFHCSRLFGAWLGEYAIIALMISWFMFFFSKNIVYWLSVCALLAKAMNLIRKSAMYFLSCINISMYHSALVSFVLSLYTSCSSASKASQLGVLSFPSILSSFYYTNAPTVPPQNLPNTVIIFSLVSVILLALK